VLVEPLIRRYVGRGWVKVAPPDRSRIMNNETLAATVARETAVLEELFLHTLYLVNPASRGALLRLWNLSQQEIKNATLARLNGPAYDGYQAAGKSIAGNTLSALGHVHRV
jgi:hypothetical protein